MARRGENLDAKVYIGGLPEDATSQEIEDAFHRYGRIRKVWVARRPPGFAFVEFEDARDAEDSVRGLDGARICGVRARVELSNGKSRRGGPSGGGRGYGGGYGGGRDRGYERSRYESRYDDRDRDRGSRRRDSRSPRRSRSPDRRDRDSPRYEERDHSPIPENGAENGAERSPRRSYSRSRSPTPK